jgi:hypothetical protein
MKRGKKLSSALKKPTKVQPYRPCSVFDNGAMNFHLRHPHWFKNWQLKNKKALLNFKGLSKKVGRAKFAENLRASP